MLDLLLSFVIDFTKPSASSYLSGLSLFSFLSTETFLGVSYFS